MSDFIELPTENLNITSKLIDQVKLNLDINDFYLNDVILISSGTATGKTTNVAKLSKDLKSKYNCNILSIVNLISLSREQILTFKRESDIDLKDYQNDLNDFGKSDGVICINSLFKLQEIEDFKIENTIIYIDEVNDLIRTLTHNESLDKVLNIVYTFLIKLIKNCKKIILSDATINQNTLNLLSSRKENNKTILLNNICKKFNGIDAIRFNDEYKFIEKIRNHIKNKKYFLFGCDRCKTITSIYSKMISEFETQKEDFILITSETKFKVNDASNQFKDKYVFYSPSITTGVSFILKDIQQIQFIYISDKPLITPISIYQMSSRTRNMSELNYYCAEIKPLKQDFETLKEIENKYKKLIKMNEKILSMSKSINENDEIKIVENTFFKLYCYNEFIDSFFNTGYLQHYENILKNNGFNLKNVGELNKMEKNDKKDFSDVYETIKDEQFKEFIDTKFTELIDEQDLEKVNNILIKHSVLNGRFTLLNLPNREETEKYKIFLTDEYALRNYFNFLGLFRTSEYTKNKSNEKITETFKIKNLSNNHNKILLLEEFEKHYKIIRLNLNFEDINLEVEISEKFKTLCKAIFRTTKDNYKTKYDLLKIYVHMIKNICGDIPVITSKRLKKNKVCTYEYKLNIEILKDLITLAKYNNYTLKNFNIELIKKLTEIEPDTNEKLNYKDEDDLINYYLFQKTNFKK